MSAAPSIYPRYGLAGLRMGAEEYLALGKTPERCELFHGVVVMSPRPAPRHSKGFQEILFQLGQFARAGGRADVYAQTDLKISDCSVLRPDIYAYYPSTPTTAAAIPDRLSEAPDLVVEVLSPGSEAYDLITKKEEYEQRGVKECWVIDPRDARTRAWHREGSRLIESLVEGLSLASRALPGFTLDLGALAKAIGRPPA